MHGKGRQAFDSYFRQQYGDKWPLLSSGMQKATCHAAMSNTFAAQHKEPHSEEVLRHGPVQVWDCLLSYWHRPGIVES